MFWTTTVTIKRFARTTPMDVREVVITSETQAPDWDSAKKQAAADVLELLGDLDSVMVIEVSAR